MIVNIESLAGLVNYSGSKLLIRWRAFLITYMFTYGEEGLYCIAQAALVCCSSFLYIFYSISLPLIVFLLLKDIQNWATRYQSTAVNRIAPLKLLPICSQLHLLYFIPMKMLLR